MPSMTKIIIWLVFIFSIPIYFVYIVKEGLEFQIAGGILILSLTSLLIFTGGPSVAKITEQKTNSNKQNAHLEAVEIPPPVLELEGPSYRKEEKIRRSRRINDQEEIIIEKSPNLPELPLPPPSLSDELIDTDGRKIAMKYVATIDPQSQMELEIDNFVLEKRIRRNELREKITIERRMELAKRRISKVNKWAEIENGEDLALQLKDPNHGLTVISESVEVDASIPHGISFVRIDHQRILKVRIPLKVNKSSIIDLTLPPQSSDITIPAPPSVAILPLLPPPGLPPLPKSQKDYSDV